MDTNSWTTGQGGEAEVDAGNQQNADYLRKMLAWESQFQNITPSPLPPNPFGNRNRTLFPGAHGKEPLVNMNDWRAQLRPDSRQRIVDKMMETLKKHLPFSSQEGLEELEKITVQFEEKIYTAATSQADYLRKITLKMLMMKSKSVNGMPNSLPSGPFGDSNRTLDVEDGYTWRKYGGRRLKGNQMSTNYYRCTNPNCPTKKKVVRSLERDVIKVIYEGMHVHPKARSLMSSFSVTSSSASNDVTQVPSPITNDIIDQEIGVSGFGGGQVESDTTCENSWDGADLDSQSSRSGIDEFDEIEGKKW